MWIPIVFFMLSYASSKAKFVFCDSDVFILAVRFVKIPIYKALFRNLTSQFFLTLDSAEHD